MSILRCAQVEKGRGQWAVPKVPLKDTCDGTGDLRVGVTYSTG
jgi:hypothetical protein